MKPYSSFDTEQNTFLAFESNKVGMFIVGSHFTGHAMENGKDLKDWGFEVIPADPDTGKTYAFAGAEVLTVPTQSKNKEEAIKFIQHMTDEPVVMKICKLCNYGILPSTKTVAELDEFKNPQDLSAKMASKFIEISTQGKSLAPELNPSIEDIGYRMSTMIQEIFLTGKDIDKAADECANDINKLYLK